MSYYILPGFHIAAAATSLQPFQKVFHFSRGSGERKIGRKLQQFWYSYVGRGRKAREVKGRKGAWGRKGFPAFSIREHMVPLPGHVRLRLGLNLALRWKRETNGRAEFKRSLSQHLPTDIRPSAAPFPHRRCLSLSPSNSCRGDCGVHRVEIYKSGQLQYIPKKIFDSVI